MIESKRGQRFAGWQYEIHYEEGKRSVKCVEDVKRNM
jgi:hypothetical protein